MGNYTSFFIIMGDSREIIYLALSNQVLLYSDILRRKKITQDERGMAEYIIKRSEEIMDDYSEQIRDEILKPIPKPSWTKTE